MTTRALLIGVNQYACRRLRADQVMENMDKEAAEYDVETMDQLLQGIYQVRSDDILKLTGYAATTWEAVVCGLQWLTLGANRGDTLVLYASGHGGQVADDAVIDERDRFDEVFCPSDTDWQSQGQLISDDHFCNLLVKSIPPEVGQDVRLEMILEFCSSGGVRDKLFVKRSGKWLSSDNCVVWAACAPAEKSHAARDASGRMTSLFTQYFADVLRGNPGTRRDQLRQAVRDRIAAFHGANSAAMTQQVPSVYPAQGGLAANKGFLEF